MKLSNKTLKKFIKGAVYFEEEKGYLIPYKYSKALTHPMTMAGDGERKYRVASEWSL